MFHHTQYCRASICIISFICFNLMWKLFLWREVKLEFQLCNDRERRWDSIMTKFFCSERPINLEENLHLWWLFALYCWHTNGSFQSYTQKVSRQMLRYLSKDFLPVLVFLFILIAHTRIRESKSICRIYSLKRKQDDEIKGAQKSKRLWGKKEE